MTETEAGFQEWLLAYARTRGWRIHHDRAVRTPTGYRTPVQGDVGFPDLVLARNGVVVFAELKAEGKYMDAAQRAWRDAIMGPRTEWYLWRPSDRDAIMRILA